MSAHTPTERLYFLDWLRIMAFATLVLFHVGMYYVTWDFHVKSPFAGPGLEPWMVLTAPWRMSLLFMVSGAATACMLRSGSTLAVARRRSRQLLLPLLFGIVFIIPPQSYFQVVQKFAYTGGYFDFFRLYLGHYHGFCSKGVCLILPTWNHLWFLPYLWVYTLLLCTTLALFPTALQTLARAVSAAPGNVSLMLVPMLLILLARLVLFGRFPTTYALWGDWFSHVIYLAMFVAGAVFATPPVTWPRLQVLRWPALWLALGFWALLVAVRPAKPIEHGVIAVYQWSALVAAFGFAVQHLNVDAPFRARLVEAVFPVYILHQTILIVASQLLLGLHWRPAVEAPVLIVLTLGLSYLGYEAVRRVGILRPWFGMKIPPKGS
jgi:glucans biosynthesis protein C